ncbi:hypothetical protein NVP1193O_028 [Vibrio phage 1.193.O._10N.286.52.C6]|nr:hypothetical protein NVP1193O_028 [Vibrio phage 1.193.O._10N.286.52.C6]
MKTDTTFDHWDTTPVQALPPRVVKKGSYLTERGTYKPDEYTSAEWRCRQSVEHDGDDSYTQGTGLDFSEFDYL